MDQLEELFAGTRRKLRLRLVRGADLGAAVQRIRSARVPIEIPAPRISVLEPNGRVRKENDNAFTQALRLALRSGERGRLFYVCRWWLPAPSQQQGDGTAQNAV